MRILFFLSILLTTFFMNGFCDDQGILQNVEECDLCCSNTSLMAPMLEIKEGYFFFSDKKMRKIYHKGGFDVQVCGTYPIGSCFQIYGSVEYFERHGRSLNAHEKTRIWEIPLSLGLKSFFTICQEIQYYITLGPRYFFVNQHNYSCYVDKNVRKNGIGGFLNTGFSVCLCENLLLDIFGEYSYYRAHFHSSKTNVYGRTIQVGGFTFGGGLGYTF